MLDHLPDEIIWQTIEYIHEPIDLLNLGLAAKRYLQIVFKQRPRSELESSHEFRTSVRALLAFEKSLKAYSLDRRYVTPGQFGTLNLQLRPPTTYLDKPRSYRLSGQERREIRSWTKLLTIARPLQHYYWGGANTRLCSEAEHKWIEDIPLPP